MTLLTMLAHNAHQQFTLPRYLVPKFYETTLLAFNLRAFCNHPTHYDNNTNHYAQPL